MHIVLPVLDQYREPSLPHTLLITALNKVSKIYIPD